MVSPEVNRQQRYPLLTTHQRVTQFHRRLIIARPSHQRECTHLRISFSLTRPDSDEFSNLTPSCRDHLLDRITESIIDQESGVAPATIKKQIGSFDRWRKFLEEIGIEDEWLSKFNQEQRNHILSAFAGSCRRNHYGKTRKPTLSGKTVKATITHVRAAFRTNFRQDPALDKDKNMSLVLIRQLQGYVDTDPSEKQQKALPLSVFKKLMENTFTPLDEALGQLATGAFFFGMRNCEYLSVRGGRKTIIMVVSGIRFFKNNVEIKNKKDTVTQFADTVSITFIFRKIKRKM
jgi:hypothetical protein